MLGIRVKRGKCGSNERCRARNVGTNILLRAGPEGQQTEVNILINFLHCRTKTLSRRNPRKIFRGQQLNAEIFNVKIVILTDGLILVFICLNEEQSFNIRKVQEYVNCISFFSELKKCQLAGNS